MIHHIINIYSKRKYLKNSLNRKMIGFDTKTLEFLSKVLNKKLITYIDTQTIFNISHKDILNNRQIDSNSAKVVFSIEEDLNFEKILCITTIKSYGSPAYLGDGKFAYDYPEKMRRDFIKLIEFEKYWNQCLVPYIFNIELKNMPEYIIKKEISYWVFKNYPELIN